MSAGPRADQPGLIPQAPMHTASLVVSGRRPIAKLNQEKGSSAESARERETCDASAARGGSQEMVMAGMSSGVDRAGLSRCPSRNQSSDASAAGLQSNATDRSGSSEEDEVQMEEVSISVVEQRVSNLVQGCFCE
jgi:hypothetical protein